MSYNYLASQCPIPLIPTAPPSQAACTDSTTTAGALQNLIQATGLAFDPTNYNQFLAACAAGFAYPGFGGVMSGLTLSTATGLALPVAAGVANIGGPVPYGGGTVVVPDSTTLGFIWLLQNGTLTCTTSITHPSSNCAYIGNFTTSGGNVAAVDYTSVCYCTGGGLIRYTNDRSAPSDSPNSNTLFYTITQAGQYHWNGANYFNLNQISTAYVIKQVLTGNFTALSLDNGMTFLLDPSGSTYKFILPNPSTLPINWAISISNIGSSGSIQVYDYTGTTTLYCTLSTTNTTIAPFTTWISGAVSFPAGSWTPGKPTPSPSPSPGPG